MSRRNFVKSLAGTAGLVGLTGGLSRVAEAAEAQSRIIRPGSGMTGADPADFLPSYTRAQRYRTRKQTSYDHTGGNLDYWNLAPGDTREIFFTSVPGAITHIWFTGVPFKEAVLRAYWDGSPHPSIEAPIGDFFGLNVGEMAIFDSAFLACTPSFSLNSYFAMPYHSSARFTLTNEGKETIRHLYFQFDYVEMDRLPPETLYFHAQYRQATPTVPAQLPGDKNLDGAHNYVFVETHGRGHLMGVTLGVVSAADGWMGEGDDMTFIDDEKMPITNGTGLEDYFNGSWGFTETFGFNHTGVTLIHNRDQIGARNCAYRFHTDNPIAFTKYLKHTIEHGTGDNRGDYFYSVAYWYQDSPATDFPVLPSLTERMVGLGPPKYFG